MIAVFLSFCGLALIAVRMLRLRSRAKIFLENGIPKVSIVVPARNEEKNLPALLESLNHLRYPNFEIIVVDDQSEDKTAEVASSFGVNVIRGTQRPSGWMGKQWACQQGANHASGDYVLFTDADTVHKRESLQQAISFITSTQSDLISTLPWHSGKTIWEKSLGVFHLILLTMTAPYSKPKAGKLFAIGQYLLFKKSFYDKINGHGSVRDQLVEDIPIATRVIENSGKYSVLTGPILFEVKMYESYVDFLKGWTRNFRAGMKYSRKTSFLEAMVMIAAFTGAFSNHFAAWVITGLTFIVSHIIFQRLGRFGLWSIVLSPFAVATFCLVSFAAVMDELFKRPLNWKNRSYSNQVSSHEV